MEFTESPIWFGETERLSILAVPQAGRFIQVVTRQNFGPSGDFPGRAGMPFLSFSFAPLLRGETTKV
jgi:hypothetical protein